MLSWRICLHLLSHWCSTSFSNQNWCLCTNYNGQLVSLITKAFNFEFKLLVFLTNSLKFSRLFTRISLATTIISTSTSLFWTSIELIFKTKYEADRWNAGWTETEVGNSVARTLGRLEITSAHARGKCFVEMLQRCFPVKIKSCTLDSIQKLNSFLKCWLKNGKIEKKITFSHDR